MNELTGVIAPAFYGLHQKIKGEQHTHYWLSGGRGSCKSSTASAEIILGMMRHPEANAVALRKVGNNLKDSVYEQLVWAIEKLGVAHLWDCKVSPLVLTYRPTGQKILFRGADKPRKIKSTKVSHGYIRYIWYEEVDEFGGMAELRVINQSLMRGGSKFDVFYTYNPPKSVASWVNMAQAEEGQRPDTIVHHSTYLSAPSEWLGEQFIAEAEHLKTHKPELYLHEYLGEVTGTGGEVFDNVVQRQITDGEISRFDRIRRGIDFGYATDPFVYGEMQYDRKHRRLYIFREIYAIRLSNRAAVSRIRGMSPHPGVIAADSAEPKSIAEMQELGLTVIGSRKGPDSVEYGIKFLQDLEEIVIDPVRCPNAAREFSSYELEKDRFDNFIPRYPDKNNHTIDMVRYALEEDMRRVIVR